MPKPNLEKNKRYHQLTRMLATRHGRCMWTIQELSMHLEAWVVPGFHGVLILQVFDTHHHNGVSIYSDARVPHSFEALSLWLDTNAGRIELSR